MTPISVAVLFLGLMIAIPGTNQISTYPEITCDTDFTDLTYSITPLICPGECWRQYDRNQLCGLDKYSGGSICLAAMQLGLIDDFGGFATVYKNMNVSFKPVGGSRNGVASHNCSRSKVSYTFEITCDTNGNAKQALNGATCPPGCGGGLVLGSDPYHVNSSVCSAAVHAGKVTKEHGGAVTFYNFDDVLNISGLVGNGVAGASGSPVKIFTFKLIDECKRPTEPCDNNATCSDDICGFRCSCTPGYEGKLCDIDIDECGLTGSCHANATCNNTKGSFICSCNAGLYGDGKNCGGIETCYAGVKDGRVKNSQMTASSRYFQGLARIPSDGRLDGASFWRPKDLTGDWIQVDFLESTKIYGVVTQGGRSEYDFTRQGWVTKFKIKYSEDEMNFTFIKKNSTVKVFDGNVNWNSHKINKFPQPVTARYFRLVIAAYTGNWSRLRLEYLTC